MPTALETVKMWDRLLAPLGPQLSPELTRALAELKADSATQEHLEALADKNTAGTLTEAESAEYEALVTAGAVLGALKARARFACAQSPCTFNRRH